MTDTLEATEEAQDDPSANLPPGVAAIHVTSQKSDREVDFERDFGSDIEASVEMFGAEVVHSTFIAQAVIRCQAVVRGILNNPDNATQAAVDAGLNYTPGVQRRARGSKKDPFAVLAAKVQSGEITAEEIAAEIQKRLEG